MKTEQLLQTDSMIQQNIFRENSEFSFDVKPEAIQNIVKAIFYSSYETRKKNFFFSNFHEFPLKNYSCMIAKWHSNNCRKRYNMSTRTESVNPCIVTNWSDNVGQTSIVTKFLEILNRFEELVKQHGFITTSYQSIEMSCFWGIAKLLSLLIITFC